MKSIKKDKIILKKAIKQSFLSGWRTWKKSNWFPEKNENLKTNLKVWRFEPNK
jgi:hypothetical protein